MQKVNQDTNVWIIGTQLQTAIPAYITAMQPDGTTTIYWIEADEDGKARKVSGRVNYSNVRYSDFTNRYNVDFKYIVRQ